MAALVLRLRDRQLSETPIRTVRVTIGRETACDLVIDNAAVSRTHAVVTFANDMYHVEDAESQNGITVNGKQVKSSTIDYGDVIGIGKFEIQLVQSNDIPVDFGHSLQPVKRNIMRTMQMDVGAAAKARDEAIARIAAQKGLPPPAARPSAPRNSPAAPPPAAPPSSDAMEVIKIAAMVLVGVGTLVGLLLYVLG